MAAVLTAVVMLGVFAALYVALNRRAGLPSFPAEQRRGLIAVVGCALLALLIGLVTR